MWFKLRTKKCWNTFRNNLENIHCFLPAVNLYFIWRITFGIHLNLQFIAQRMFKHTLSFEAEHTLLKNSTILPHVFQYESVTLFHLTIGYLHGPLLLWSCWSTFCQERSAAALLPASAGIPACKCSQKVHRSRVFVHNLIKVLKLCTHVFLSSRTCYWLSPK